MAFCFQSSLNLAGSVVVEMHKVRVGPIEILAEAQFHWRPCPASFDFLCLSQTLFFSYCNKSTAEIYKGHFYRTCESLDCSTLPSSIWEPSHEFQSQGFQSLCDVNDVLLWQTLLWQSVQRGEIFNSFLPSLVKLPSYSLERRCEKRWQLLLIIQCWRWRF